MSKHLNLISYFGGKYPHLTWLIPLLPKGNYHFVDIMCGSANVALNVDYPLITINDLNDDVVNLFKVLRDHYDEFVRRIYFTPFARAELNNIIDTDDQEYDNIEKARRYFTRSQLGYGANGSQNNHRGAGMEYTIQRTAYYRVDNWNFKLNKLPEIVDRLRHFQIESRDALLLFEKVNRPGTVVYFDPPYMLSTRKSKKRYRHEQEDDFHHALAAAVKSAECHIAISGYATELYDEIFPGLIKTIAPVSKANNGKVPVQECLWTNYDPAELNGSKHYELWKQQAQ